MIIFKFIVTVLNFLEGMIKNLIVKNDINAKRQIILKWIFFFFIVFFTNYNFAQSKSISEKNPKNLSNSMPKENTILPIKVIRQSTDSLISKTVIPKSLVASTTCNKVYASGWSGGRNSIYELNGSTMVPIFTAPQFVGGLSISANGNAYYDNGSFVSSPLYSSDLISQTDTGGIIESMTVGEVADASGNVYYIDNADHLRKKIFGVTGISSDLGLILFDTNDTIGPTLVAGDMAFDGNGRLYWYSSVFGNGLSYLYTIDMATLKASNLGNVGPDAATGLAFDANGNLITTSNGGATVMSVNLSSPSLNGTVIGTATPSVFDLGSCASPFFNPSLTAVKSVANITSGINPAITAQVGDILEYTIVVNNTGNLMSNNSLFGDVIPLATTYVPNSTIVNGILVPDSAGNMPFVTPAAINSPGQLPGIIDVGSAATITFRVTVNVNTVGSIPNTAAVSFPITNGGVTSSQTINSNTVIVVVDALVHNDDVVVYNHLTPNGDGHNETFYIDGIDKFPNNTVEIYNRWGILIYEASGYNNKEVSFKGISQGRMTIAQEGALPEGTYYYVLKYVKPSGETIEKASYLFLNR